MYAAKDGLTLFHLFQHGFVFVHAGVGPLEHIAHAAVLLRIKISHTDGDNDLSLLSVAQNLLTDLIQQCCTVPVIVPCQDNGKLISADAEYRAVFPDAADQRTGVLDIGIAFLVPKPVIHVLQSVYIADHNGKALLFPAADLFGQPVLIL